MVADGVSPPKSVQRPSRVVAIGDVHGAFSAFRAILLEVGLVDSAGRWTGGDAVLVQTGDFLDRGESALRVARWLRTLQREAPETEGRVEVLLGNHEVLNLFGDYRDVTERILGPLVDERSQWRRRRLCQQQVPIRRADARVAEERPPSKMRALDLCVDEHPLGLVEYVDELGPEGELGRWLRTLRGVAVVGDTLFVHGGLSPVFAGWSPERIDAALAEEIRTMDEARRWLVERRLAVVTVRLRRAVLVARRLVAEAARRGEASPGEVDPPPAIQRLAEIGDWLSVRTDGPLWYRGWSLGDGADESELESLLAAQGVRRMVVGHTPETPGRIISRFGGRLITIDTGMLTAVYRGAPAALEIRGDALEAVYLGRRVTLAVGALSVGARPSQPRDTPVLPQPGHTVE